MHHRTDYPDAVLEVDHSTDGHGGTLARHESWDFPEVWVEVGLTIHLLEHGRFQVAAASRAFPAGGPTRFTWR